jgi:hypothetical protein
MNPRSSIRDSGNAAGIAEMGNAPDVAARGPVPCWQPRHSGGRKDGPVKIMSEVKTVLWSFIGLGGRGRTKAPKVNPLVVIIVAFVLVFLILGVLALVARHAAS